MKRRVRPATVAAAVVKCLFLTVSAILILYPIFMVVTGSFRSNTSIQQNPFGLPSKLSFANFDMAWNNGKLYTMYGNSLIVTIVSVLVIVLFSSLIAYVISRRDFRPGPLLYGIFVVGMTIPAQVGIIPLYIQMVNMHLNDSLLGLIIIYVVSYLSYSTFVMYGFIRNVSPEIQEAAIVDGCGVYRNYSHIIMPLSKPVILTVSIFNLMFIWNDMFYAMVMISTPARKTLMIGLLGFTGQYFTNYAVMFAGVVLVSLPMIILFLLLQKRFIEGATSGAVKG